MIYKALILATKSNDSIFKIFEPLISIGIVIAIGILLVIMIISHYFALFRIRKELIKIREILDNSPMLNNDNKKND